MNVAEPLTGRAAAEAIGLCAQLGNSGARFDRRGLAVALRSRIGRGRIRAGLTLAILVPRGAGRPRESRRRGTRRVLRAADGRGSPGRPSRPDPDGLSEGGR